MILDDQVDLILNSLGVTRVPGIKHKDEIL